MIARSPRQVQRSCRAACRPVSLRRHVSTSTSPSPKITAAPFQLSPDAALNDMHTSALFATAHWKNVLAFFAYKLFGHTGLAMAKQFGLGDSVELKQFKPVYWPTWRVDAAFKGKAWAKGYEKDKEDSTLSAVETYVPGNSFAPLSYLSFANAPLEDELPTFDEESLNQLGPGMEIAAVPFTISPLAVVDHLRNQLPARPASGQVVFDKDTWKEFFFAAYPIMFPLYVADFEYESMTGEKRTITMFKDAQYADVKACRLSFAPAPEIRANNARLNKTYFFNPLPYMPTLHTAIPLPRIDVEAEQKKNLAPMVVIEFRKPGDGVEGAYDRWIVPAPTDAKSIPASPLLAVELEMEREGRRIEWDDKRIRSWNEEDRLERDEFFAVITEEGWLRRQLKGLADARESMDLEDAEGVEALGKAIEQAQTRLEEVQEKVKQMTPAWAREDR